METPKINLGPKEYPSGYEMMEVGQTITFDCMEWNFYHQVWQRVSISLVGLRYYHDPKIGIIARPSPRKRK